MLRSRVKNQKREQRDGGERKIERGERERIWCNLLFWRIHMYMSIKCLLKEVCSLVRNAHDILIIRDFHTNVI